MSHTEHVRYGTIDQSFLAQARGWAPEDDGPFFMLNLMKYREVADYQDGRDEPPITGRQADDRYAPLDLLATLGAEIVLFGNVTEQLRGDEGWERVAMVRYPSMRSFLEMNEREDFALRHVDKDAGMERTIICACYGEPTGLTGATSLCIDLLSTDEPPPGALTVKGTPVGDGRAWNTVVLSPGADVADAALATTVLVKPLWSAL